MSIAVNTENIVSHDVIYGEEVIGKITYNPKDEKMIERYWNIYNVYSKHDKKFKEFVEEFKKLDLTKLDKDMETLEEFEEARDVIEKGLEGQSIKIEMFNELCAELDGIFGEGSCRLLTQGYCDFDMLKPLFSGEIFANFEDGKGERKKKTSKYKMDK